MKYCKDINGLLHLYAADELNPDEKQFVDDHIKHCYGCEEELSSLMAVTDMLFTAGKEGETVFDTINWNQIKPAILEKAKESDKNQKSRGWVFPFRIASAFAVLLIAIVISFNFKLLSKKETQAVSSKTLNKMEMTLEQKEMLRYLNQTEAVFTEIMHSCNNADDSEKLNVNPEQLKALLYKNRYIRHSLENANLSNARSLCNKINWVLVEISSFEQDGNCRDMQYIKNVLQSEGLLLKMHLVREEIEFTNNTLEV